MIQQGDLYWIELEPPSGSEPGYSHPHVVIQNNLFNQSRLSTILVCALTSNLKRALAPGNVKLEKGEGSLSKESVVVVSQLFTVDKAQLGDYIGSLSKARIKQIVEGIQLLIEPREVE